MEEQRRSRDAGESIGDGVRAFVGVVGALKDAVEETFQELLDQGELTPERAREAARTTMRRAQETMDDMRERIDWVARKDFDSLRAEVDELRRRIDEHLAATHGMAPAGETRAATGADSAAGETQATQPAAGPAQSEAATGAAADEPAPEPEQDPDSPRFTIDEG